MQHGFMQELVDHGSRQAIKLFAAGCTVDRMESHPSFYFDSPHLFNVTSKAADEILGVFGVTAESSIERRDDLLYYEHRVAFGFVAERDTLVDVGLHIVNG
jgi:hypothetical protein